MEHWPGGEYIKKKMVSNAENLQKPVSMWLSTYVTSFHLHEQTLKTRGS